GGDAVEHQHRGERQLRVARPEQLATGAGEQVLVFVARRTFVHYPLCPLPASAKAADGKMTDFVHRLARGGFPTTLGCLSKARGGPQRGGWDAVPPLLGPCRRPILPATGACEGWSAPAAAGQGQFSFALMNNPILRPAERANIP